MESVKKKHVYNDREIRERKVSIAGLFPLTCKEAVSVHYYMTVRNQLRTGTPFYTA